MPENKLLQNKRLQTRDKIKRLEICRPYHQ